MRSFSCILCTTIALSLLFACSAGARDGTGPGAFLPRRVNSSRELSAAVRKNPVLAALYSRHFGASPEKLAEYFEKNLKLVRLRATLKSQAFYVNVSGKIYGKMKTLPAGTLVFVADDGQPVIDWRCGNPLTRTLPYKRERPPVKVSKAPVVEKVLPAVPAEIVAAAAVTLPEVTLPPVIEASLLPTTAVGSLPSPAFSSVAGALALLPLAAASFVKHNESPAPPVPEPSAIVTMSALCALGGSGRYLRSACRTRKRRSDLTPTGRI